MKTFRSIALPLIALMVMFLASAHMGSVEAAKMTFDPTSVNAKVGDTFKLTVKIDVGTSEVLGTDVLIDYDASLFKAVSVTDGTFLAVGKKDLTESGKVAVNGYVESAGESVTGSGPFMDVTFEVLKKGTGTITFDCELGETGESNISENVADATDLIECSQNGEAVIVADGGTTTGGTTGGTTSGGTSAKTPSSLPKTGIVEDMVIISMIVGGVLVLVGAGTRMFT